MKIAVITTSRADWNGLGPVFKALQAQGAELRLLAIHDHAGMDVVEREGDGMVIRVGKPAPSLGTRDADFLWTLSTWQDHTGWRADMVVVCGDRHETLMAVYAAVLAGIPVAHIAGGDVTLGSSDDKYRDAISMLASLHFPTHERAKERLIAMGCGVNVYNFGSPAIDRLMRTSIMPRHELIKALGLDDARPFILANWQPETPVDHGLPEVLKALAFNSAPGVFVGVNPDPGAEEAERQIAEFIAVKPGWRRIQNMPPELYLNTLFHAACLIGNSSSGFYEAPYYGTPVINVGERQSGRLVTKCITTVEPGDIGTVLISDIGGLISTPPEQPYGDGTAAPKIADAILKWPVA